MWNFLLIRSLSLSLFLSFKKQRNLWPFLFPHKQIDGDHPIPLPNYNLQSAVGCTLSVFVLKL